MGKREIDEQAALVIVITARVLRFIAQHPLQTAFDIIGLCCAVVVAWAFVPSKDSSARTKRSGGIDGAFEEFCLTAPDDLRISIREHSEGAHSGLCLWVESRRTTNLEMVRVRIRDAKSFDSHKSAFRESPGFATIDIDTGERRNLPAGEASERGGWLIRIKTDHLEVGSTNEKGILKWRPQTRPTGRYGV